MFPTEDLSALSAEQLEEELAAQAAHVDAGVCRLLGLVAECERRLQVEVDGTTFASWLAWRCSLLPGQAREYQRVAGRLEELPEVREAFARGELSYAKTATLTRIAEPESEPELVRLARGLTAPQLQRAVGAYRQLTREEAADQQEKAFLHHHWAADGSLSLRARLAAGDGAVVLQALEAGREAATERHAEAAEIETLPTPPRLWVSDADALVAMADLALSRSAGDRAGGDRYQVVVHVDADTLAADRDGRCELDEGHVLAAETARRLACDASVVELLERDGQPLALGRKRRTVSPAIRRALKARDRGCRFPGCHSTRFVDAHRVHHWSRGGETNLDNLISLCTRHHRLVHEQGHTIRIDDDGEAHFTNRHGVELENVPRPPPSSPDALPDRHRARGLHIDHETCEPGAGDRMDLGLAVDALFAITAEASAGAAAAPL